MCFLFFQEEIGVSKADWKNENSKEIDSIYLHSTINPYDLMKNSNSSQRKLSLPENLLPIDNSTPVTARSSVLVSLHEKSLQKSVKDNQPNASYSPPLNRVSFVQNNTPGHTVKDVVSIEKPISDNIEVISLGLTSDTKNVSPQKTADCQDPTGHHRLSTCDLFESFDEVILDSTSKLIGEKCNNLTEKKSKKTEITASVGTKKSFLTDEVNKQSDEINIVEENLENNISLKTSALSDSKLKSSKRNSLDIFFDSFSFNTSGFSQAVAYVREEKPERVLDELDSNCGGQSLLEASLILNNISKQISPPSLKRKLSESGEIVKKKKRKKSPFKTVPVTSAECSGLNKPSNSCRKSDECIKKKCDNSNMDNLKEHLELSNNQKKFVKNTRTTRCKTVMATSTQKYPCNSSTMPDLTIDMFSQIPKFNTNRQDDLVADSDDDCFVESPTPRSNDEPIKRNNSNSRLQLSNVVKNSDVSKNGKNPIGKHQISVALTNSYVEAAFGDTFYSVDTITKEAVAVEVGETSTGEKTCKKEVKSSTSTPMKRHRSKDLIQDNDNVLMTPPR